jgi:L-histidine N-alpha-methyltransferase
MTLADVTVHSSQFPENIRRELLDGLRARRVNPKFHYDSYKQAQKWLALHETFSPSRTDPDCLAIYDRAFAAAAERVTAEEVQVIGLGCGGGQKEARLLRLLAGQGKKVSYRPCDVSLALALTAREAAREAVGDLPCAPLVCDLALAGDLNEVFGPPGDARGARMITFFGMIPNFEPELIWPRLAGLVRAEDVLLLSANLAPGPDYAAGMRRIFPGYDNLPTRDWLTTFLFDLGFAPEDGTVRFAIEDSAAGLKRVSAYFDLTKGRALTVQGESFEFRAGESIRLFFSYRYTPERMRAALRLHGLDMLREWVAASGEEGVFLCQRKHCNVSRTALMRGTSWVRNRSVLPRAASTAKKGSAARTSSPK